jgi:hypothetical protein
MLKLSAAAGAAAMGGAVLPGLARAQAGGDETMPQVPRKTLGKTEASIPILLFGAGMKLDPRFDPKLAEAYRFGVNYIDAADCYGGGTCEPAVANFLEKAKIDRETIWITSKSDRHDPEGFEDTLNTSLEKLRLDYVDMYFLHAVDDENVFTDELLVTVERAKKQGKIRHFGFSCHDGNVAELLQLAAVTPWVETVMFRYNFRKYGDKELNAAIDAAAQANVGLIAMKTQGSEASFADAWQKFEKTGKWNKHQAVLKGVWSDERITAAVSHMDTFEKLKENIAAALDTEDLGQADFEAIEQYARATRAYACDGCDHLCGGATDAPVRIGATMRALMYHDVYGEPEKAYELFGSLPENARRLEGVDFLPANRACPNGIDVAAHMKRAAEVLRA